VVLAAGVKPSEKRSSGRSRCRDGSRRSAWRTNRQGVSCRRARPVQAAHRSDRETSGADPHPHAPTRTSSQAVPQQIPEATERRRGSILQAQFLERVCFQQHQGQLLEPLGAQALEALVDTGTQRAEPSLKLLLEHPPALFQTRLHSLLK
jgi:hypothetical protein